ncbi:MAG: amino acid adenylation domain-containing protein, partial [Ruminococcus sp.]|nr:amino acid adenylation domain-containing protein [Candidatus Copronaster equi]
VRHNDIIPEVCPLTEEQKGIYLECINDPESVKYNVCGHFELPNSIDVNRFVEAVKTVVRNHKVFMINIISPDGIPSMILREKEITFTEKTNDDIDDEIKNFIRPFDFENDALFRFELLHCKGRLIFLYDIHHIITDGTSFDIFINEIADVYAGKEIEKEELTIFDISAYESEIKKSEEYKIAKEYFRNKFEGIDCDSSIIPDVLTENGSDKEVRVSFEIDSELSHEKVESFVKENNITENAFFLGAFSYAIAKFNGMNESSLCTVNTGRIDKGLSSTFGMFVKTLPVYSTFDSDTTVKAFLENICNDYYYTKKNSFVPFDELVAEYGISNEITFVFQSRLFNETEIGDGKTENILADTGELVCNFDVMLMKNESGYSILAHYNASLYSKELIDSLLEMYSHILLGMLTSHKLADIDLVCEKNRQLMDSINATQAEYRSDKTVVELFREQVKKTPENICLVYCDKKYTYREVDSITDILAKNLVKNGVGKEKVVGVLIPRCEYMLIASLGILKAGGAYLPLDPTYPAERLNFMMKDSGAVLLISAPELDGIITSDFEGIRISTEDILKLEDCDVQLGKPDVSDLFVMLYTSGSTGLPKGVMFEHSNTLVTAEWVKKYFNIDETSRVTSYASYGFDAHAFDIYPVIISGAQIHIISEDIRLDLLALRDYYNKNGITHTVMTTQVGRQFALMGGFETLKHISVAGEKLTPVYVDNGYNLYNLYGPTEGSVVTSAFKIDKKYKDVPIGKAVDNLKIYIVDKDKNLLPTGAVGELWISGPHVTRGYINRPDKTAQAYGENPFCTEKGYERVYRTGDIVRLMADGNLQFVGRRDGQVKIRGFRVELTEIEEIIRRFPDIDDATVVAFDDPSGGKFVTAYIVSQKEISTEKLAEFIRGEKPPYMVPAVIMQIDSIPLTQNYKVNKRALPVPQRNVGEIIPPQNEVQQKIFDVVSEVIGHSDFGIDTDIYEAGLTSIGAVKLNVSIAKAFDVAMRIADLKTYSTIIKLEKFISSVSESESYEILEDYPLTQTQNGIFVECSANPNSVIYNIPVMFRIDSELDIEKLRQAVKATINAHPYIKTYLRLDDSGEIRAVRNDSAEPVVDIIKCIDIPDKSELVKPFELLSDRLYRIAIYQTEQGNYLFMDLHHIISDGTSEAIIISDIEKAYSGQTLEIEKFTGFEAALEEEKLRNSEKYNNAKEYYDSIFKGCDAECLPQKAPETTEEKSASYTYNCSIKAADVEKYCEENKFTLNAFFNAVFSFVLSKFDHREEIIYTTVYNGRNDSRLASAVTMLVKTIPVYANITENKKTNELIGEIQNQLINSFSNDIYSFAEISRAYNIKSDIMFIYQGDDFKFDKICGKQAEYINIVPDAAKAPITINIYKNNGSYEIVADYRANIFSAVFTKSLLSSVEE